VRFRVGKGVNAVAGEQRTGDLEINQDLRFQRRIWALQRIGWAVMALVVLVGLVRLLGTGPLSSATAGEEEAPLFVEEYERFARYMLPTTLRVRLDPIGQGEARLWVDRGYLESVRPQTVTPEPDSVEAGPDGFTYVFKVNDPNRPTVVTFDLQPETIGRLEGRVGLEGGERVEFEQFVYP
jgi:hypothetical protein